MIIHKLTEEELALIEVLENPVWNAEFMRKEVDPDWELTWYQKEIMADCNDHVSFVAARAVGKCLSKDSKILNVLTGDYKTVEEYFLSKEDIEIPAIDYGTFEQKHAKCIITDNGIKDCLNIVTSLGKDTTVTPEHPFLTPTGWIEAKDLKIGDYIASPLQLEYFGDAELKDSEIKMLSHFIAEGTRNTGLLSSAEMEFRNDLEDFIKDFGGSIYEYSYRNCKQYNFVGCPHYKELLKSCNVLNKYSYEKEIPDIIFKSSKDKIILFLRTIFGDDGWSIPNEVGYTSSSKKLAYGIKHLLLRFGINGSINIKHTYRRDAWSIILRGEDRDKFLNIIGFYTERKNLPLDYINYGHNTSDILPIPEYKKYKTIDGEYSRHLSYYPTRFKASRILNPDEKLNKFMNVRWVKIRSINKVNNIQTYNVEVEKYHTLVADDLYSHNSEVLIDKIMYYAVNNFFPTPTIAVATPNRVHMEPIWRKLNRWLSSHPFLRLLRESTNSQVFKIFLKNGITIDFRIAGMSNLGSSVVGLHTPVLFVDECVLGSQRVAGINGNKEIRRYKPGDKVFSWDGENIVEDTVVRNRKIANTEKILEIGFDSGNIKVSKEHKLLTIGGYTEAKELTVGDSLFLFENKERKYWDEEEYLEVLKDVQAGISVPDIAKKLNRSVGGIYSKLYRDNKLCKDVREETLTARQIDIIRGSLLGDGCSFAYKYRANYTTNHSYKQKDYVDWLYTELENIVRTKPRVSINAGWGTYSYSLSTIGYEKLFEINNELYINRKKTITREYLDKLTPLSLAVWWADDGSACGMFSTHSFSEEENIIIRDYLISTYNIDCEVKKDTIHDLYYIRITGSGMRTLATVIKDYLPECMLYKIGIGKYNDAIPELPEEIYANVENLKEVKITYIKEIYPKSKWLYSLEVENNHNYFVNGILTKNCGFYPWPVWIELVPTVNAWEKGAQIFVCGTPSGERENNVLFFADQISDQFTKHRITAFDNPRYTESADKANQEQYGGKESDDYQRLVLGMHAAPISAIFSKDSIPTKPFEPFTATITRDDLENDPGKLDRLLDALPYHVGVCAGIDFGYTDPTIISLFTLVGASWEYFGRITLLHVEYPDQVKFVNRLDDFYSFILLAIDEGHAGIYVSQELMKSGHKDIQDRLVSINFGNSTVVGVDLDDNEVKQNTKNISVEYLRRLFDNKLLYISSRDAKVLSELERVVSTKTPSGNAVYRVRTVGGSLNGEDHIFASLLCFAYALYLRETDSNSRQRVKLFVSRWARG